MGIFMIRLCSLLGLRMDGGEATVAIVGGILLFFNQARFGDWATKTKVQIASGRGSG